MGGTRVGHGQQRQVAPLAQCTAWTQSVDWTASQASRTTRQVACQGLHGRRNPPDEHQGSHQGQSTASNGTRHARREASGAQGDDEERPAAFWHWDCAGEPLHNAPNKGETLPGWQGLAAMTPGGRRPGPLRLRTGSTDRAGVTLLFHAGHPQTRPPAYRSKPPWRDGSANPPFGALIAQFSAGKATLVVLWAFVSGGNAYVSLVRTHTCTVFGSCTGVSLGSDSHFSSSDPPR